MSKLYMAFSMLVAGGLGVSSFLGWAPFTPYDQVKGVPKSVRNNPGAYRSHYAGYSRYMGGK